MFLRAVNCGRAVDIVMLISPDTEKLGKSGGTRMKKIRPEPDEAVDT